MKIPEDHLTEVCRFGQGQDTCAYLTMGDGMECAKGSTVEDTIAARLAAGTMTATGDHCEGIELVLATKTP